MSKQNSLIVGAAGESAVAAMFFKLGCQVYTPAFGSPDSDLIADVGGKLLRIQVKTMEGDAPAIRFCSQNGNKSYYTGKVDWLAFYSAHYGVAAFLRPEEAHCDPTMWFCDPPENTRIVRGMRYARDYPIERVIREAET